MGKKTSIVWNHYTAAAGQATRATCHHCRKELSYTLGTMSNLSRHLKIKHPEVFGNNSVNTGLDSSVAVYAVEGVEEELLNVEQKAYEITMTSFQEMEDMDQSSHNSESELSLKTQTTPISFSNTMKKDRKKSKVWDHFQRSACKTNATCLHCGRMIRMGTISNLARHLRHLHPNIPFTRTQDEAACLKPSFSALKSRSSFENNEEVMVQNEMGINSEVIELHVDNFQNPGNVIEAKTVDNVNIGDTIMAMGIITQSSQTESKTNEDFDMHDFIKPKEKAVNSEVTDKVLIKMIVKGCHPVSMVEQEEFKEFVKLLNPKYQLPPISKLTNELIPECYRECEQRAAINLVEAEGVCLYLDQWKSKSDTYMCVTAHFINRESKFESVFLACHVLNADETVTDISQRLLDTVSEWDIGDKIIGVVTDNTDMMVEAVKFNNWVLIPHFMRYLTVVLHEGFSIIKSIIIKVKNITDEFQKNPSVLAEVYSKHKSLGYSPVRLITKVKNDCNFSFTTLEMLSRFVKLRSAMSHVLNQVPEHKLSDSDWRILQPAVEIFEVFKEIKQEVIKEERVCLSKIVFFIKSLMNQMSQAQTINIMPTDVICIATNTISLLEKYFTDFISNDLVSFVMLLDPRLKKYGFSDESEYASACSKLKREVCEVSVPEPELVHSDPKSLWYGFDQDVMKLNGVKDPIGKGILELDNYLQEQILKRDQDPLVWWDKRREIYPRLFKLARKYLCLTNKYSQRESISQKTVHMLSQLKNCNATGSESQLMFLHHNM